MARTGESEHQLCEPVMMKLSAAPSSVRPMSRIAMDSDGLPENVSDNRYRSPAVADSPRPVETANFGPRRSAIAPDHRRETSDDANWAPETRPTVNVPKPRSW
ncbi:hypothetical protein CSX04_08193 [Burkholderia cepacia]|nr:hypothetical protein CSX04_08193 [Burkholderia cepacia]